jgi:hypothetical protein
VTLGFCYRSGAEAVRTPEISRDGREIDSQRNVHPAGELVAPTGEVMTVASSIDLGVGSPIEVLQDEFILPKE